MNAERGFALPHGVFIKILLLIGFLLPWGAAHAQELPDFWYLANEDYERPRLQLYRIRRFEQLTSAAEVTGVTSYCVSPRHSFVLLSRETEVLIGFCPERGLLYVLDGLKLPRLLMAGVAGAWPFSWNSVLIQTTEWEWKIVTLSGQVRDLSVAQRMPRNILALVRNKSDELSILEEGFRLRTFGIDAQRGLIGRSRITKNFSSYSAGRDPLFLAQGDHVWLGYQTRRNVYLSYFDLLGQNTASYEMNQSDQAFSPILINAEGYLIAKQGVDRIGLSPRGEHSGERNYFSSSQVRRWAGLQQKPIDALGSRVIAVPNLLSPWMLPPTTLARPNEADSERPCHTVVTVP